MTSEIRTLSTLVDTYLAGQPFDDDLTPATSPDRVVELVLNRLMRQVGPLRLQTGGLSPDLASPLDSLQKKLTSLGVLSQKIATIFQLIRTPAAVPASPTPLVERIEAALLKPIEEMSRADAVLLQRFLIDRAAAQLLVNQTMHAAATRLEVMELAMRVGDAGLFVYCKEDNMTFATSEQLIPYLFGVENIAAWLRTNQLSVQITSGEMGIDAPPVRELVSLLLQLPDKPIAEALLHLLWTGEMQQRYNLHQVAAVALNNYLTIYWREVHAQYGALACSASFLQEFVKLRLDQARKLNDYITRLEQTLAHAIEELQQKLPDADESSLQEQASHLPKIRQIEQAQLDDTRAFFERMKQVQRRYTKKREVSSDEYRLIHMKLQNYLDQLPAGADTTSLLQFPPDLTSSAPGMPVTLPTPAEYRRRYDTPYSEARLPSLRLEIEAQLRTQPATPRVRPPSRPPRKKRVYRPPIDPPTPSHTPTERSVSPSVEPATAEPTTPSAAPAPVAAAAPAESPFRYDLRVRRWFNSSFVASQPAHMQLWHNFGLAMDRIIVEYGIHQPYVSPTTGRTNDHYSLPGQICFGNSVRRGIFTLCVDHGVVYHRFCTVLPLNDVVRTYVEQRFHQIDTLPPSPLPSADTPPSPATTMKDGSFIVAESRNIITVQDPKNNAFLHAFISD